MSFNPIEVWCPDTLLWGEALLLGLLWGIPTICIILRRRRERAWGILQPIQWTFATIAAAATLVGMLE
jgi:hypothetical protein